MSAASCKRKIEGKREGMGEGKSEGKSEGMIFKARLLCRLVYLNRLSLDGRATHVKCIFCLWL
jgi:hypothetical protein